MGENRHCPLGRAWSAPQCRSARQSAVGTEDVIEALNFLSRVMRDDTPPPWIGRLSTGGVQLTWRSDDVEVEAVFDRARHEHDLMVTVGENEWDASAAEADSLFATSSTASRPL